jgi:mono/diheme cytochrome c family protein
MESETYAGAPPQRWFAAKIGIFPFSPDCNLTYDEGMSILRPRCTILMGIALLAATSAAVSAQTKEIKIVPVQPTNAQKGDDLYREFCAVCHGVDGTGYGPAAEALKTRPSNLTLITRHSNTNKFPAIQVMRIINGDDVVAAHGTKGMPTWGEAFKSISANSIFAEMRVRALVDYIQKIQN